MIKPSIWNQINVNPKQYLMKNVDIKEVRNKKQSQIKMRI